MKDEEVRELKPGAVLVTVVLADAVLVELQGAPARELVDRHGRVWRRLYKVRRLGERRNGGRFPVIEREAGDLLITDRGNLDPDSAWVFADWLEEHGQAEAADLLRRTFTPAGSPPDRPSPAGPNP